MFPVLRTPPSGPEVQYPLTETGKSLVVQPDGKVSPSFPNITFVITAYNDGIRDDAPVILSKVTAAYAAGYRSFVFGAALWKIATQLNLSMFSGVRYTWQYGCEIKVVLSAALVHGTVDAQGLLQGGGDAFIWNDILDDTAQGVLAANAAIGDTNVQIPDVSAFHVGDRIHIGDSNEMCQERTISAINGGTNKLSFLKPLTIDLTLANAAALKRITYRPSRVVFDLNYATISGDCYRYFELIGCDDFTIIHVRGDDRFATPTGRVQYYQSFDDRCVGCLADDCRYTQTVAAPYTSAGFLVEGVEDCIVRNCTVDFLVTFWTAAFSFLCSNHSQFINCTARGSSKAGGGGFQAVPNVGPGFAVDCAIIDCNVFNTSAGVFLSTGTTRMQVVNLFCVDVNVALDSNAASFVTLTGLNAEASTNAIRETSTCSSMVYQNIECVDCGDINDTQQAFILASTNWTVQSVRMTARTLSRGVSRCSGSGVFRDLEVLGTYGAFVTKPNSDVLIEDAKFYAAAYFPLSIEAGSRAKCKSPRFKNVTGFLADVNGVLELEDVQNLSAVASVVGSDAGGGCLRIRGKNSWNYTGPFVIAAYPNITVSRSVLRTAGSVQLNGAAAVDYPFTDVTADEPIVWSRAIAAGTPGQVTITRTVGTKVTLTGQALDTSTIDISIGE